MVRECRPLERELSSLKLERRSTMRTSVPASVSSAASIIPVGPPPAITTARSDIHHSSFPGACQETLHHTRGVAASPGGGTILRWRELGSSHRVAHAPAATGVGWLRARCRLHSLSGDATNAPVDVSLAAIVIAADKASTKPRYDKRVS